ncbi:MAG TPA: hypothetical protein VG104_08070 [Candidatus Dormibacteraeota bacterium]|nr:hypothetical protein [Candidatus Dormibacteraeota bacterium]
MNRLNRWARWTGTAAAVLMLFWIAASIGGWSSDVRRLTTSVHGPMVADYRAESPQRLAPLSPDVTRDASRDQPSTGNPTPRPSASGGPSPSAPGPTPTPTGPLPTLPIPTPTLPTPTPTLPTPVPTPSLPTPPPLP